MNAFISQLDAARIEEQAQRKAQQLNIEYIDLRTISVNLEALRVIPEAKARQIRGVVFDSKPHAFSLAAVFPDSPEINQLIKEIKKFGIVSVYAASQTSFDAFMDNYQFVPKTRTAISGAIIIPEKYLSTLQATTDPSAFFGKLFVSEADMSEIITWILGYGVSCGASDLHIEPVEKGATLRYRVDGVLYPIAEIPAPLSNKVNDRMKLVSKINLNVRDIPQDGRFTIKLETYDMEMRVSTIPGPNGENIVMRYLNPHTIGIQLEDLGFREDDLKTLSQEIKKPNGLILVTGPTGSGKTTTLYSCLKRVSTPENKVITIEDPIEYKLPGIEQTQISNQAGYTFASGLRAILRQDPDVILVGEIRDQETASLAINASLTGHLVLSTLHTNSAAGAMPRMIDMGVEPFLIVSTVNVIIAQRLVRRLCEGGKDRYLLSDDELARLGKIIDLDRVLEVLKEEKIAKEDQGWQDIPFYHPKKTAECEDGYKGRVGIHEILKMSSTIKELVIKGSTAEAIEAAARKEGMITMIEDGVYKAAQGLTSIEEIFRVVSE